MGWITQRARVLLALLSCVSLLGGPLATAASAQTLEADYEFNGDFTDRNGHSPALHQNIGTTGSFATEGGDGVYRFSAGGGLTPNGPIAGLSDQDYSIDLDFKLTNVNGYNKIVDFSNGASDTGLYIYYGVLCFYPVNCGRSGTPILPNVYVNVLITRDATMTVRVYLNGNLEFSFPDPSGQALDPSGGAGLRFLGDDNQTGLNESSPGTVTDIDIVDQAVTLADLEALDAAAEAGATPELDSIVLFAAGALGLAGIAWRQRRKPAA